MDASKVETHEVARFDALLRDLMTFELVERDTDGDQPSWHLSPLVQRRLEVLASPMPPAHKLIYFGHRCGSCGEIRPTRFRWDLFLCESCLERVSGQGPHQGEGGAARASA